MTQATSRPTSTPFTEPRRAARRRVGPLVATGGKAAVAGAAGGAAAVGGIRGGGFHGLSNGSNTMSATGASGSSQR